MDKNQEHNARAVVVNPYAKKKRKRPEERKIESSSSSTSTGNLLVPSHYPVNRTFKQPPSNPKHININSDNNNNNNNGAISATRACASDLIISASDKAGMEGIDRSKIDAIILRESGNSLFMQQQRKRDEKVNDKVRQLRQRLREAAPSDCQATEELDELIRFHQRKQANRATSVVVDMVRRFLFDCIGYDWIGLDPIEVTSIGLTSDGYN